MIAAMGNIAAETDADLLARFASDHAQDAFTELVKRHVNLVYSAALRQVRSPQLAEEIAQSVFADLARNTSKLRPDTVLVAWLHTVTRRTAVDVIRKEARHRLREQIAVELTTMNANESCWLEIEPMLDEAVAALDEADRAAVLLRYFENKSLREVGAHLGVTDDAAQKRVSRAVERLREFFSKRNATIGASGLAVLISANAVQSAPVGLVATISAAVLSGTAISTSTAIAATKAIAMTTFQKTIVTAVLFATVGAGLFEAHQNSESQKQIQNLQQQQDSLNEQFAQLQRERDDATNQLDGLLAENAQLKSNSNERELLKLRGEVTAASRAAADASAKTQSLRNGSQAEPDYERNQTRTNLDQFFKLANLSPEKAEQYVTLEVEMKRRQNERMTALLGGNLSVAEAVRLRDQDNQEQQNQRREILGSDGWATLQSIADGMRNNVAKGLIGAVQANMGNNPLTQEQSDRLQSAIKAEVAANTMDDTDLFRPVDEWTQMVTESQQHVLRAASQFLTPTQQETLQFLERANLAQLLQQREQRRKALGIKQ
jgi:RNA polymerase sigma factor (sigma-70 family)